MKNPNKIKDRPWLAAKKKKNTNIVIAIPINFFALGIT